MRMRAVDALLPTDPVKRAAFVAIQPPAVQRALAAPSSAPQRPRVPEAADCNVAVDPATGTLTLHCKGLATTNESNRREDSRWTMARGARHQRTTVREALATKTLPPLPVEVRVVRHSRGTLDAHDGLPTALKHVVDGIADAYGLPDSDPRFVWRYAQQKARGYGVTIAIARAVRT